MRHASNIQRPDASRETAMRGSDSSSRPTETVRCASAPRRPRLRGAAHPPAARRRRQGRGPHRRERSARHGPAPAASQGARRNPSPAGSPPAADTRGPPGWCRCRPGPDRNRRRHPAWGASRTAGKARPGPAARAQRQRRLCGAAAGLSGQGDACSGARQVGAGAEAQRALQGPVDIGGKQLHVAGFPARGLHEAVRPADAPIRHGQRRWTATVHAAPAEAGGGAGRADGPGHSSRPSAPRRSSARRPSHSTASVARALERLHVLQGHAQGIEADQFAAVPSSSRPSGRPRSRSAWRKGWPDCSKARRRSASRRPDCRRSARPGERVRRERRQIQLPHLQPHVGAMFLREGYGIGRGLEGAAVEKEGETRLDHDCSMGRQRAQKRQREVQRAHGVAAAGGLVLQVHRPIRNARACRARTGQGRAPPPEPAPEPWQTGARPRHRCRSGHRPHARAAARAHRSARHPPPAPSAPGTATLHLYRYA